MPKTKSKAAWLRDWINRINGNSIYTTDGKIIFCQPCGQQATTFFGQQKYNLLNKRQAPSEQFFQLKQHDQTAKHQANVQRQQATQQRQKQQFLTPADTNIPDQFSLELCQAMVAANIPFNKLDNQTFRNFLDKYCGKAIPCARTMGNYLEINFNQVYF